METLLRSNKNIAAAFSSQRIARRCDASSLNPLRFFRDAGIRSQVNFLTEISRDPASRFLPFAPLKQKHRCGFLIPTHRTQVRCFIPQSASLLSGCWDSNPESHAPEACMLAVTPHPVLLIIAKFLTLGKKNFYRILARY